MSGARVPPLQMNAVCLSGWRDMVLGSTATATQVPVAPGTAVVRRLESWAPPLLCYWVL